MQLRYTATAVSKVVTKMLCHYDQEESQTDGSRHWDTCRPTLVRAFAREEARDFDDGCWLTLIHEGSDKIRIEFCEDKLDLQVEGARQPQRNIVEFSIHLGEWIDSGRKRD